MTDRTDRVADFADPTTEPFWRAADREQLVIQRCRACGDHQFYPRPFCLACDSDQLEWVQARGSGTVYSATTVHLDADPSLGLPYPYQLAIVELDEGPRLLTNLTEPCGIGARVHVRWRPRPDQPPVPVFQPTDDGRDGHR